MVLRDPEAYHLTKVHSDHVQSSPRPLHGEEGTESKGWCPQAPGSLPKRLCALVPRAQLWLQLAGQECLEHCSGAEG